MIGCRSASAAAASSNTMESSPPDSATARLAPGRTCPARAAASAVLTTATASCGVGSLTCGEFLELAIAEQLVLARFEHRVEWLLLHVAQRLGQGLLEHRHRGGVVAVRTADRLGDDLVDQAERLQALRRDPERLRGFFRVLGRLPHARRPTPRREHPIGCV